jgi:hypothetical protein
MDDSFRQDALVILIPSLFSYLDRLYNIFYTFYIFLYVVGLQRKDFDLYCYCNLNKSYWPTTADYQVADMH